MNQDFEQFLLSMRPEKSVRYLLRMRQMQMFCRRCKRRIKWVL